MGKKKDEQLFAMDRFDPDSELGNEKGNTILPDKVIIKGEKALSEEKPKVGEVKKKRRKKKKGLKQGDEAEGFTVLGDPTDSQKKKVARVLPQWLAQPDIMQVDLQAEQLAVADRLAKEGVTHLFPVQRQVIPRLLSLSSLY